MSRRKTEIIEPWERQPGETEKAYEAFLVYKNMGAGRTIVAVGRRLSKSRQLMTRWATRYNWKERVQAFDRENERIEQGRIQKERAAMIKRHIKMGLAVQGKALKALDRMDPESLTPGNIREFLRFGVMLEKETRAVEERKQEAGQGQDAAQMLAAILEKAWGEESSGGKS